MVAQPLITAEQVAAINEARTVLEKIAHDAHMGHDTQASGMVYAQADTAAAALFHLLVWFDSYANGNLSKAQLHNEAGRAVVA